MTQTRWNVFATATDGTTYEYNNKNEWRARHPDGSVTDLGRDPFSLPGHKLKFGGSSKYGETPSILPNASKISRNVSYGNSKMGMVQGPGSKSPSEEMPAFDTKSLDVDEERAQEIISEIAKKRNEWRQKGFNPTGIILGLKEFAVIETFFRSQGISAQDQYNVTVTEGSKIDVELDPSKRFMHEIHENPEKFNAEIHKPRREMSTEEIICEELDCSESHFQLNLSDEKILIKRVALSYTASSPEEAEEILSEETCMGDPTIEVADPPYDW